MASELPMSKSPVGSIIHFDINKHFKHGYTNFNVYGLPHTKSNIFADNVFEKAKKEPKMAGWLLQTDELSITGRPTIFHQNKVSDYKHHKHKHYKHYKHHKHKHHKKKK